ncbi:replication protein [Oceanobacillus sp. FSL W7-1281]|uniref:replication protein n=1 Tax=Oceanobacillus sp. FSL W7-1281 TaxID=2921698 RepID=UPI0030DA1E25
MAKYRQIHIEFWQDGFVLDLTPEEKYFYLYLMTNSKTTQCGIYELPKRIIETETGYNRETVDKLLQRFTDYGKIIYHEPTKEIMILNWIKFNWINSPKVISLIKKELANVKNPDYIKVFKEKCIEYGYGIDTVSIDLGEERELRKRTKKEKEKKEGEEKNKDHASKIKDLLPAFSSINKFNQLNKEYWDVIRETRKTGSVAKSVIYNNMVKWKKYDPVVVEYALKEHIAQHKGKKEEYTVGIMRNTSKEEAEKVLAEGRQNSFKAINGGRQHETRQSSYESDYSQYDFSQGGDL